MTVLEEIAQEKQQVSQRLMGLDAEWTNLSGELRDLNIAERALKRFGRPASRENKRKNARQIRQQRGMRSAECGVTKRMVCR
jgi:hypothetical protein